MKIAVFDFDGTLTTRDTFILFVKFSKGELKFWKGILLYSFHLAAFKTGLMPNWYVKQKMFTYYFGGMSLTEFNAWGEKFADQIDKVTRKRVLAKNAEHKSNGDQVIIISASVENWIRPWASRHGISTVLGTRVQTDAQGILTGRFETRNCYGPEKVNRLLELYPDRGTYTLVAYGDSRGDKDLIEFADEGTYIKEIK